MTPFDALLMCEPRHNSILYERIYREKSPKRYAGGSPTEYDFVASQGASLRIARGQDGGAKSMSMDGARMADPDGLSALVSYLTGGGYQLPDCP